jgi:hypothetical protein
MQRRSAIKSARALVVLSSDGWTKVLVRRQAPAFEIGAGMAQGCRATRFQQRSTSVVIEKPGDPLDAQAWVMNDSNTFEARWRERVKMQ